MRFKASWTKVQKLKGALRLRLGHVKTYLKSKPQTKKLRVLLAKAIFLLGPGMGLETKQTAYRPSRLSSSMVRTGKKQKAKKLLETKINQEESKLQTETETETESKLQTETETETESKLQTETETETETQEMLALAVAMAQRAKLLAAEVAESFAGSSEMDGNQIQLSGLCLEKIEQLTTRLGELTTETNNFSQPKDPTLAKALKIQNTLSKAKDRLILKKRPLRARNTQRVRLTLRGGQDQSWTGPNYQQPNLDPQDKQSWEQGTEKQTQANQRKRANFVKIVLVVVALVTLVFALRFLRRLVQPSHNPSILEQDYLARLLKASQDLLRSPTWLETYESNCENLNKRRTNPQLWELRPELDPRSKLDPKHIEIYDLTSNQLRKGFMNWLEAQYIRKATDPRSFQVIENYLPAFKAIVDLINNYVQSDPDYNRPYKRFVELATLRQLLEGGLFLLGFEEDINILKLLP